MSDSRAGAYASLLEGSYAAFNNGDAGALLALYTEDCVWDISRFRAGFGVGLARVYRGHQELAAFLEEFQAMIAPWGGARAEFDRVVELDDGRLWIEGDIRFGTADGNAELFDRWIQLLRVRDGKIGEIVIYWDAEEARRDALLDSMP